MTEKIAAFIPAAGLGERLLPITNCLPKPLLPIVGKPIIELALEKVVALKPWVVGINLCHLGGMIRAWVEASPYRDMVALFPEDQMLGTGGALKNAARLLCQSVFVVHNADIVSDIDLSRLVEVHRASGCIATLAVHDCPKYNRLVLGERGLLMSLTNPGDIEGARPRVAAFTGIAVYESRFLNCLPDGYSSVIDGWLKAIEARERVGTHDVSGCTWSDIGTPAAYAATIFRVLREMGETVHIDPSSVSCVGAAMDGFVVLEAGANLGKGTSLANCIVLTGASLEAGTSHTNCICGSGFDVPFERSEVFAIDRGTGFTPIGTGGSDRSYYRIERDVGSFVLLRCPQHDPDFQRQIEYSRFFSRHCVPVPELLSVDVQKGEAVFQDLGDLTLYSWLKCPRQEGEVADLYCQALRVAALLHTHVSDHIGECPLLRERVFDYTHLRWETQYFVERFVEGVRGVRVTDAAALDEEFHRLAVSVDALTKVVVHRDFQSQNIMVTKGCAAWVIDYQGARMGPPAYDVVSLLWDPYHRLEDQLRERLIRHYIQEMKVASAAFDEEQFRQSLLPCRLQRHMQALGAFGFLSLVKGKRHFLRHAEEGLRLLKQDVTEARAVFPVLYQLVRELHPSLP